MADWFEEFENFPIVEKSKINWPYTLDFKVQSEYIVNDIKKLLVEIKVAEDDELLHISQHCFNILSWIRQMDIMGFHGLGGCVDELLEKHFGDKNVINNLQKEIFGKWVENKNGQYKIGENWFNVYDQKIYYKNFLGKWFLVEKSIFDIMPKLGKEPDAETIKALDTEYAPTKYHKVFLEWQNKEYSGEIPTSLLPHVEGGVTPERYFQDTLQVIEAVISSPVSYKEVEKQLEKGEEYLEYLVKVSLLMCEFVQSKRKPGEHTVYLLRDCLVFYELQNTLDILTGQKTSNDQLYIGRKLLTNKKREGGHWYFTQEVLFHAYLKYPNDFNKFYEEYSKLLDEYTAYSPEFASFMKELVVYIEKHIDNAIKNNLKITIVDLGFQGSINMLIKYVIDKYCSHRHSPTVDIEMYVLAEWFKSVYGKRYVSETYSLLTHIEVLARNELLYQYKMGSLKDGEISVIMGSESNQKAANLELVINTMVANIANKLRLI